MKEFCSTHGIIIQKSVPYTPEQNGIAERKNRTLKECARAILIDSGLGKRYAMDAILFATFIRNRIPRKLDGKTPIELFTGKRPTFKYLQRFGATCFVHLDKAQRNGQTLGPKAIKGRLIAHLENGYLVEKEDLKRITSVHVKFMNPTHAESIGNSDRDEIGDLGIGHEGDDPVDIHTTEEEPCNNEDLLSPATPTRNRVGEEVVPNAPRKVRWSYDLVQKLRRI